MESINILLVEDNEGDIVLTLEAFEEAKFKTAVGIARDGVEAINFLLKKGKFLNVKTPDLIFLDYNLPCKNGLEVLQFIKSHDSLMHIPVIMLTTSTSQSDIVNCYKNHANCYITKPSGIEEFINAIQAVENFWFKIAKLPPSNVN